MEKVKRTIRRLTIKDVENIEVSLRMAYEMAEQNRDSSPQDEAKYLSYKQTHEKFFEMNKDKL